MHRFILNLKGIPYRTVWLEYPDIEPTLAAHGIAPTHHLISKTQRYTLPAIIDPLTSTSLSDSLLIAEYLDSRPGARGPALFPPSTRALQRAFAATYLGRLTPAIFQLIATRNASILSPRGQEFYTRTREAWVGPLDALAPPGSKAHAERLAALLGLLDEID